MTSSVRFTPLVVSVKRKFLFFSFSILRAYATSCLHTSKFTSGSPPKKSTSRFFRREINLEILPQARVFHQKVERPFPGLKVHQALLPVELAL